MQVQFQLDKIERNIKLTYKKEQIFIYYMLTAQIYFSEEELDIMSKFYQELGSLLIIQFTEQYYTKPTIFRDAELKEEEIPIFLIDLLSRNDFTIPCSNLEEALEKKDKIRGQLKKVSDKLKSLISIDKKEIIKF
ncbi:hypothetical protein [Aureivirga sp. CE67]|uniref:hypothetical protein n=1 Tax=Aureivirga sp. CE67 TaxID=1788983 RepID=UPI0018C9782E|nr:hypothetical protein [Aureivirga sp. CE67]